MRWIIYKHTNLTNGKVYIGQTSAYYPNLRWKDGQGYIHNILFYNDILTYGWNGFSHEVLTNTIYSQEEADRVEAYYIKVYNAHWSCGGYNLTWGNTRTVNRYRSCNSYNTRLTNKTQNEANIPTIIAFFIICALISLIPIFILHPNILKSIILNPITFIIVVVLSSWGIYKCSKKY